MSLFTSHSAARMHREGLNDEAHGLREAPPGNGERYRLRFTARAWNDWQFLAAAKFPAAVMQPEDVLAHGLTLLRESGKKGSAAKKGQALTFAISAQRALRRFFGAQRGSNLNV